MPAPQSSQPPVSKGVVFLTLFLDLAGFSIIFPLFPAILDYYLEQEGHAGLLGALLGFLGTLEQPAMGSGNFTPVLFGGILGSIYSLLQFVFAPIWGTLSDRHGRRRILLYTVTGTALSYILWFFSGSFLLFIVARLLSGAMAGNLSVVTAAIADITTRRNRAGGMALVGIAFGLGFILGPVIGGLTAMWNPLNTFPGLARLGVTPFSGTAGAAFILAMINVVWVWTRFRETLPSMQKGASLMDRNPIRLIATPVDSSVRRVNFVYFFYILAFSGMEFTLTFLASKRFDYQPADIAWLFVHVGVVIVLTQGLLVRRLVPRFGEKAVAATGLCTIGIGLIVLSLASTSFELYGGLTFMAVGSGLANPSLSALASLYAPPERQGTVLGVFRSVGSLARAIGPLIASFLFWWYGSQFSYLSGGCIVLLAFFLALFLQKPAHRDTEESAEPVN